MTGYKSSPFAIHYETQWFTLWDIDDMAPYEQILADGKPWVMAIIAISPIFLQTAFFLLGLRLLRHTLNRWGICSFYYFILFEICEIYAYIPIRTFTPHADIYRFLYATNLSPWFVAIPGIIFAFWGIHRMLLVEAPHASLILQITKTGQ